MTPIDYLGWAATAVFVSSYFYGGGAGLRRTQMAGATLWVAYGLFMHAAPVVVANLLVLGAAAWSLLRQGYGGQAAPPELEP